MCDLVIIDQFSHDTIHNSDSEFEFFGKCMLCIDTSFFEL